MTVVAERTKVLMVGAGLAGLACALRLSAAGCAVEVLEAADTVGGRVRTDAHAGFLLDHGFQVFLPAYPDARRWPHLRTYDIKHALPAQPSVALCTPARTRTQQPGVYACGDYLDTASINGALRSGDNAAGALLEDLSTERARAHAV